MPDRHAPGGIAFPIIVGCPRSGTTMIASRLIERYRVAIPLESHFIPLFWRWRRAYAPLRRARNRRRLLDDIYLFTELWIREHRGVHRQSAESASILASRPQAQCIVDESHDYRSLVWAIFRAYAEAKGEPCFADKSVFRRPVAPQAMDAAIGPVRVVHIVRDGRDVALSWRHSWFGIKDLAAAARAWAEHIAVNRDWGDREGGRYLEVRYEKALADPDGELSRIAEFLDLQRRDVRTAGATDMQKALSGAPEHRLLARGAVAGNVDKWRTEMSGAERRRFERVAGGSLRRLDYETEYDMDNDPKAWHATDGGGVLSNLRPYLHLAPRRAVKEMAPLLFHVGGRPAARWLLRRSAALDEMRGDEAARCVTTTAARESSPGNLD